MILISCDDKFTLYQHFSDLDPFGSSEARERWLVGSSKHHHARYYPRFL